MKVCNDAWYEEDWESVSSLLPVRSESAVQIAVCMLRWWWCKLLHTGNKSRAETAVREVSDGGLFSELAGDTDRHVALS
jgi:organic radical activating enzyme